MIEKLTDRDMNWAGLGTRFQNKINEIIGILNRRINIC